MSQPSSGDSSWVFHSNKEKASLPCIFPNVSKKSTHWLSFSNLKSFLTFFELQAKHEPVHSMYLRAPNSVRHGFDYNLKWQREVRHSWVSSLTNKFPSGATLHFQARQLHNSTLRPFHHQDFPLTGFLGVL